MTGSYTDWSPAFWHPPTNYTNIRFESLKRQNKFNKVTVTSLLSGGWTQSFSHESEQHFMSPKQSESRTHSWSTSPSQLSTGRGIGQMPAFIPSIRKKRNKIQYACQSEHLLSNYGIIWNETLMSNEVIMVKLLREEDTKTHVSSLSLSLKFIEELLVVRQKWKNYFNSASGKSRNAPSEGEGCVTIQESRN